MRAAAELREEERAGPVQMIQEEQPHAGSADGPGEGEAGDDWAALAPEQRLSAAGPGAAMPDVVPGPSSAGVRGGVGGHVNPEGHVWTSVVGREHHERLEALWKKWKDEAVDDEGDGLVECADDECTGDAWCVDADGDGTWTPPGAPWEPLRALGSLITKRQSNQHSANKQHMNPNIGVCFCC